MKKSILIALLCMMVLACGCGRTKTLHCDGCQREVKVSESSNMEEDWIVYCKKCNEKYFADDPLFRKK